MFKFLIINFILINVSHCFVPAKVMSGVLDTINLKFSLDFGQVGPTFPHEEIMRRGVYRSIVKYFYDQPNGNTRIDLNQTDKVYLDINQIYSDYYNKSLCELPADDVISKELQPNVAVVDFDPSTKDLPFAHFDAESFNQSNNRVIAYKKVIQNFLAIKDYSSARKFTGQILHTIQDFYSHSNWVEMGMTSINDKIGTESFSNSLFSCSKTLILSLTVFAVFTT